jgi:hypothetical protein
VCVCGMGTIFEIVSHFLSRLALNLNPPVLCLLSS